jgi:uncharacterized protein YijF (DUF1287 family)
VRTISRRVFIATAGVGLAAAAGLQFIPPHRLRAGAQILLDPIPAGPDGEQRIFAEPESWTRKFIGAAESQIGVTVTYDPAYTKIGYPGGDVPIERGVCTDVIVRAYRDGPGADLQKLVHEDMTRNFGVYPKLWGLTRPDSNIDHRRVPNLATYFGRKGEKLKLSTDGRDYRPGDIVTQMLPGGLTHIILLTHRASRDGQRPLAVHNIGAGARLEDVLFAFEITGHYRFNPAA